MLGQPKANRVLVSAFPTFRRGSQHKERKRKVEKSAENRRGEWGGVGEKGVTLPIFHAFTNVNDRFLCTFYALDAYTISFSTLFASLLSPLSSHFPTFSCPSNHHPSGVK